MSVWLADAFTKLRSHQFCEPISRSSGLIAGQSQWYVLSKVSSNQATSSGSKTTGGSRIRTEGAKRAEILAAATDRFGRDGYEKTRWADIAGDVGVGPTALYHYFESKHHCLYVIIDQAIEDFRARFTAIATADADPEPALLAVLDDCFDLSSRRPPQPAPRRRTGAALDPARAAA